MHRRFVVALLLALAISLVPLPALGLSPPRTLVETHGLGTLAGRSEVVDPAIAVDYLGVSWLSGPAPSARFLVAGRWTPWTDTDVDDLPPLGRRTFAALMSAHGADALQIRGSNRGLRAVSINTTDGPRSLWWEMLAAEASHLTQPVVISRTAWGADESYRFDAGGAEKWPPAFYATKKLIVHHTATTNADPDPAATVRAIYRYHAIDQGYGDLGYNFLIDAQGRMYKGRYSGPANTTDQDTPTGENAEGLGVTAAHTGGWNSGTMGVAILGTFTSDTAPAPARSALVDHLAWESERHGIDPLATSSFTNPVSGAQKTTADISGHRDWGATECPGGTLYADLPAIRQDVSARVGGPPPSDTTPPAISAVRSSGITRTSAAISWTTDEPSDSGVEYWVGSATHAWTPIDPNLVTAHRVTLAGLRPNTKYSYKARSADAAGNTATSATFTFRTKR